MEPASSHNDQIEARLLFGEEEGACGYGAFPALSQTGEAEWSWLLLTTTGCSAAGSARGLGPRCRRFESCHSDHFRIGVDTFVSTPIFCIIDLLLPRKMMLYDQHFHVSKKNVCEIRKTCTRWGFRLKDKKEIVCEMGRPPLSGKLRLDFSAFLSIAILQAERLERRI